MILTQNFLCFFAFIQPSNKSVDSYKFQLEYIAIVLFCKSLEWPRWGSLHFAFNSWMTVDDEGCSCSSWRKNAQDESLTFCSNAAAESKSHTQKSAPGLGTPNSQPCASKRWCVKLQPLRFIWGSAANLVNRSERQGASAKWDYAILPLMGLAAMARCATVISLLGSVQGFRALPRTISPMCLSWVTWVQI